jgi:hypothetical protein
VLSPTTIPSSGCTSDGDCGAGSMCYMGECHAGSSGAGIRTTPASTPSATPSSSGGGIWGFLSSSTGGNLINAVGKVAQNAVGGGTSYVPTSSPPKAAPGKAASGFGAKLGALMKNKKVMIGVGVGLVLVVGAVAMRKHRR